MLPHWILNSRLVISLLSLVFDVLHPMAALASDGCSLVRWLRALFASSPTSSSGSASSCSFDGVFLDDAEHFYGIVVKALALILGDEALEEVRRDGGAAMASFATAVAILELFYGVGAKELGIGVDDEEGAKERVTKLVLGCAVQCDGRAEHIQTIMGLDKEVQAELMSEIEAILAFTATLPAPPEDDDDDADATQNKTPRMTPMKRLRSGTPIITPISTARSFDGGARAKRLQREVDALKSENEELLSENEKLRAQADASAAEIADSKAKAAAEMQSEKIKLQRGIDERESALSEELECVEKQRAKLELELSAANKALARSQTLRDEVDVLRSGAQKAERLAETLAKQKRALEDFVELKRSARTLREKNEDLGKKLRRAEAEAAKAADFKKEVDVHSASLAEAELEIGDMKETLRSKDEQIARLEEEFEEARSAQLAFKADNEALHGELAAAAANDRTTLDNLAGELVGSCAVGGLGEGLTELNPDVRDKIEALERENEALKSRVSEEGGDHVRELSCSVGKLERVREALEKRIAAKKSECVQLESKVADCEKKLSDGACALKEKCKENDHLNAQLTASNAREASLSACLDDSQKETAKWIAEEKQCRQECERISAELEKSKHAAQEIAEAHAELQDAHAAEKAAHAKCRKHFESAERAAADRVRELERGANDASQSHLNAISELEASWKSKATSLEQDAESLKQSFSNDIEVMKRNHASEVESFELRLAAAEAATSSLQDKMAAEAQASKNAHAESERAAKELAGNLRRAEERVEEQVHRAEEAEKEVARLNESEARNAEAFECYKTEHSKSNKELSAEMDALKDELESVKQGRESDSAEHLRESCANAAKIQKMEGQLLEGREKYLEISKALTAARQKMKKGAAMLQELKAEIRRLKDVNDVAECAADQAKSRMRQAEAQLAEVRAVQKATGKLSGENAVEGKHQSEMKIELERLANEVRTLRSENASLSRRAGVLGVASAGMVAGTLDAGTAHLIRGYEARVQALEDEKSSISLKRANEVKLRHDAEKKTQQAAKECERLRARIVSLQLQLERASADHGQENSDHAGNQTRAAAIPLRKTSQRPSSSSRPTILSIEKASAGANEPGECKQQ